MHIGIVCRSVCDHCVQEYMIAVGNLLVMRYTISHDATPGCWHRLVARRRFRRFNCTKRILPPSTTFFWFFCLVLIFLLLLHVVFFFYHYIIIILLLFLFVVGCCVLSSSSSHARIRNILFRTLRGYDRLSTLVWSTN